MAITRNFKHYIKSISFIRNIFEQQRIKRKYNTEISLLRGKNLSKSAHKSIIHFSLNKSATTYVKKLLNRCAVDNGLISVSMNDYAFATKLPFLDTLSKEEIQEYKHVFKPRGYLYSAFGGMVEDIDDFSEYIVLFMTRDPRDILVSNYYSMAYSHPVPVATSDKYQDFIDQRTTIRKSNIDTFVKQRWESVYHIFDRYERLLLAHKYENVHILRYEDMVNNYELWLKKLLSACELSMSEAKMNELILENQQKKPKVEDINAHVRKGEVGDYKNKLRADTIAFLDEKFSNKLSYFGYEMTT